MAYEVEIMTELPAQKGGQKTSLKKRDGTGKGQQHRRRKNRSNTPKPIQFNAEDAQQRDHEIDQCFHLLSNKSFKLFRKGSVVTSYGLTFDVRLPERISVKFVLNVPNEYPKSPLQLHWKRSDSVDNFENDAKLQNLVRNFNYKARDMSLQKTPIIAQLNYLVYRAEDLAASDFKLTDRREREFYAAFL